MVHALFLWGLAKSAYVQTDFSCRSGLHLCFWVTPNLQHKTFRASKLRKLLPSVLQLPSLGSCRYFCKALTASPDASQRLSSSNLCKLAGHACFLVHCWGCQGSFQLKLVHICCSLSPCFPVSHNPGHTLQGTCNACAQFDAASIKPLNTILVRDHPLFGRYRHVVSFLILSILVRACCSVCIAWFHLLALHTSHSPAYAAELVCTQCQAE